MIFLEAVFISLEVALIFGESLFFGGSCCCFCGDTIAFGKALQQLDFGLAKVEAAVRIEILIEGEGEVA